jgi:diguanylate cyclase (GGDEF)-like protein
VNRTGSRERSSGSARSKSPTSARPPRTADRAVAAATAAALPQGRRGDSPVAEGPNARRRASRFLWSACEALLGASEPRTLNRALDALRSAFECDGVALHAVGPSGAIEPWCARGSWQTGAGDLRDCMSVPLARGDERVGTLELLASPGKSWQPAQLALIRTAAGTLGAALGARLELQRLRQLPGRDALTGLPDGPAFAARITEELARARRHALPASVVVIDIDRLGAVNERFGRETGDAVLAETALVLKLALRESDIVARLGGDDFGLLLPETDRESALRCADRVRRALEEHRFDRAGHVSASAGVAACPQDGAEAVELLGAAEKALGLAKKAGRRRVVVASPSAVH